jgi:hypothetical protein
MAPLHAQLDELRRKHVDLAAEAAVTKSMLDPSAARAATTAAPVDPTPAAITPIPAPAGVAELDVLAEQMVVKAAYAISREQARARVLKANPRLYAEYLAGHASRTTPAPRTSWSLRPKAQG